MAPIEQMSGRRAALGRGAVLLVGFAIAVLLRVGVGGAAVADSAPAGLTFSACLLLLSAAVRVRVPLTARAGLWGLLGAALLTVPVVLGRGERPLYGGAGFATWAVVVAVVATAEEVFLRGALYDAVTAAAGPAAAITVGAVAFALLHVPLYGWRVVPLDLAVGVLLGELRRLSGTPAAPAVSHVLADLAAWFLR
jgi:membrane protease YdiL (CAAX protease family)